MIDIYKQPWLRVSYESRIRLLELEYLAPTTSLEMRNGFAEVLSLAKQYQVRLWLGNLKQMGPINLDDQAWLYQHWFPQFLQLGLDKLAVVNSRDALNRLGVASVVKAANVKQQPQYPETRYFDDLNAAQEWVRTPLVWPALG